LAKKTEWKKYTNEKEPDTCSLTKVQQYKQNREEFLTKNIPPYVKKKGDIIYGSRAMNKQLPKEYRRKADDYDIWSKKPKLHADKLEDVLDECIGCNMFEEQKQYIPQAKKYRYRVQTVTTGKTEADYTKPPKGHKYKTIGGVKYQDIKHQKKRLQEMKKDPALAFRLDKTNRDLNIIEAAERKEKKKAKLKDDGFTVMNPFW